MDYFDDDRKNELQEIDEKYLQLLARSHRRPRVSKSVYESPIGPKKARITRRQRRLIEAQERKRKLTSKWREAIMRKARPANVPAIRAASTREIEANVAARHHIGRKDLLSRARHKNITRARQELWYILRMERGLSYKQIGTRYDRDHTSIISGVRKHCSLNNLPYPHIAHTDSSNKTPSERRRILCEPELFEVES